jgi:hypothetical protein
MYNISIQINNIKNPREYDQWYNVSNREIGDKIIVKGTLDLKDQNPFGSGFIYSFEDSEKFFLSGENLGDIGEKIIVEIEIDDMILPTVIRILVENHNQFYSPLLILIGSILLFIGLYFYNKYRFSKNFKSKNYKDKKKIKEKIKNS